MFRLAAVKLVFPTITVIPSLCLCRTPASQSGRWGRTSEVRSCVCLAADSTCQRYYYPSLLDSCLALQSSDSSLAATLRLGKRGYSR